MNTLINSCEVSFEIINLSYYSHLIPIFFSLFLAFLVYFKAHKNILSKIFLAFSISFCLWLIADLLTWVSNDYYLIYSTWSPVDHIETVMYIIGLYFVLVFINKKDLSRLSKFFLFLASLFPFLITITKNSVLSFNHSLCEASNNVLLLDYRFFIEILVVLIILINIIKLIFNNIEINKKSSLFILSSMFLFLTVFGVTSYLSAITVYYELNLYALFVIPVFLMAITYSIFSLDIFNIKIVSTYFIVFGLIILNASQLIFITSTTNILLTLLTIILSIILSIILFKNLKKESDQRVKIEKLSKDLEQSRWKIEKTNLDLEIANDKLKGLDKLKTEFVSLASHQLRSPLTAIKGYTSMLLEGDYGEINKEAKETIERVMQSSNNLTLVVEDLLNVSKIESGGMKYEIIKFDFSDLVRDTVKDLSITAEKRGLKLTSSIPDDQKYFVNGDKEKLRQILINLIDNSIKYTKEGSIVTSLVEKSGKIILSIKDTGVGISKEAIKGLFQKFSRGDGAKLNSSGSGLGLYLVKEIVEAHKGRVWIESEGIGKGSTFFVELDEVK